MLLSQEFLSLSMFVADVSRRGLGAGYTAMV
jgi:hypothetical protein